MNCKLVAGLACGMALLLGACSGNPPPAGTSTTPTPPPPDGEDMTGVENAQEVEAAQEAIKMATDKVEAANRALAAVDESDTPASRNAAQMAIDEAIAELDKAEKEVTRIFDTVADTEENAALRTALFGELTRIRGLETRQTDILRMAKQPLLWFTGALARQTLARDKDKVRVPPEDVSGADISRIPRRVTPSGGGAATDNSDRIQATTFKDIPYASGKMVFSTDTETASHSGEETFKVDGHTSYLGSVEGLDMGKYTGLRLTGEGLVIRFGGTGPVYPDTIMKLGSGTAAEYAVETNKWDLTIAFGTPDTVGVDKGVASWTGNGDFYWKAIADADDTQLQTTGPNYAAGQLPQPEGHKDLGVYEVWLSNHIGVDQGLEPTDGSSFPSDDKHLYLKYAAYGLFLYTADDGLVYGRDADGVPHWRYQLRAGRVQSINFGYSAFQDATGKKTSNIKTGISSGTFTGETIAIAHIGDGRGLQGALNARAPILPFPQVETKLARGDVTLTVNIPKTAGSDGDIKGSITNFQEWDALNNRWKTGLSLTNRPSAAVGSLSALAAARGTVHTVYLNDDGAIDSVGSPATVEDIDEDDGTFEGVAKAYGPSGASLANVLNNAGGGAFKGNFYGPRENPDELEVAGSWHLGLVTEFDHRKWVITGSFGAKQAAASSN